MVDSSNLGSWIDAVVDATLGSGVASQLAACSQGFREVSVCVSGWVWVCFGVCTYVCVCARGLSAGSMQPGV